MKYQEDFFTLERFVRFDIQNRIRDKVGQLFRMCSVGKSLKRGNPLCVHVLFALASCLHLQKISLPLTSANATIRDGSS